MATLRIPTPPLILSPKNLIAATAGLMVAALIGVGCVATKNQVTVMMLPSKTGWEVVMQIVYLYSRKNDFFGKQFDGVCFVILFNT